MTQYQLTLDSEAVQRLFTGDGQLGRLLEAVAGGGCWRRC